MPSSQHLGLRIIVMIIVWATLGCATDQAAKQRADKPATVGIWGGAYRPSAIFGLVTDVSGAIMPETRRNHVDEEGTIKDGKNDEKNAQNIKTRESQKIDLGVHIYPSQKSAFFFGIAANKRKQQTDFDSPNVGSSLANPSYSNIQVSDDVIAIGPAVGWDWIWPNGVSFLMDLGPRWDVTRSRNMNEPDSESSQVDTTQRDKLLKKLDNRSGGMLIEPRAILGFSF